MKGLEKEESGFGIPPVPVPVPSPELIPLKAAEQSTMLHVKKAAPATKKAIRRRRRSGGMITALSAVSMVKNPPLI